MGDAARCPARTHNRIAKQVTLWAASLRPGARPLAGCSRACPHLCSGSQIRIVRIQQPAPVAVLRDFSTAGFVLMCGGAISRLRLRSIMRSSISPWFHAPLRNVVLLPYEFLAAAAEFFSDETALLLWHPPVDELHSIENKAHKFSIVFLTLFQIAIEHTRSLTVSKVFPFGGESGAQASSLRPSTEWKSSANPATAVAGDQGRRSRDVRAKALASPSRHGGAGWEPSLAPATATEPGERNSSGARLSQDNRTARWTQSGAWAVRSH